MEVDDAATVPAAPLSPSSSPSSDSAPKLTTLVKRKSPPITQASLSSQAIHPSDSPSTTSHPLLPPLPPPSVPSRLHFPQPSYDAHLDGCVAVLPRSLSPSHPHDLLVRHFAMAGADGRCWLTLLDAFFLSHTLSVLRVTGEDGKAVSARQLLVRACAVEPRFPSQFAVYAHWTARGWVVRQGSKMGVDFLLYPHHQLGKRTHSTSARSRTQRGPER